MRPEGPYVHLVSLGSLEFALGDDGIVRVH